MRRVPLVIVFMALYRPFIPSSNASVEVITRVFAARRGFLVALLMVPIYTIL